MSPKLEIVQRIMMRYARLYAAEYREGWIPKNEHIKDTLDLLEPPLGMPGLSEEDLLNRLSVFFRFKEDWLVRTRHNYGLFTKHIHRWIPIKREEKQAVSPERTTRPEVCGDCGTIIAPGEACRRCFPQCKKCRKQHLPEESCEVVAERMNKLKRMFGDNAGHRTNQTRDIGSILKR